MSMVPNVNDAAEVKDGVTVLAAPTAGLDIEWADDALKYIQSTAHCKGARNEGSNEEYYWSESKTQVCKQEDDEYWHNCWALWSCE